MTLACMTNQPSIIFHALQYVRLLTYLRHIMTAAIAGLPLSTRCDIHTRPQKWDKQRKQYKWYQMAKECLLCI